MLKNQQKLINPYLVIIEAYFPIDLMQKYKEKNQPDILSINLNKIQNISALKIYGTYSEVSHTLEEKIGIKLKANDWQSLLQELMQLSLSIEKHKEQLNTLLSQPENLKTLGDFNHAKEKISQLLSQPIKARSWHQLREKLNSIVSAFSPNKNIDKHAFFEKHKKRNFMYSSRLEGINISDNPHSKNMSEILKKHSVKIQNGQI